MDDRLHLPEVRTVYFCTQLIKYTISANKNSFKLMSKLSPVICAFWLMTDISLLEGYLL